MDKSNQQMCFLLKFGKKEHMEALMCGNLYMHTLEYFINLERNQGDQIAGDQYEAKYLTNDATLVIPDVKTHRPTIPIECSEAVIDMGMSKFPVFCAYLFDERNRIQPDILAPCDENGTLLPAKRYGFSDDQKENMRAFGDSVVMITNPHEFIARIRKAASSNETEAFYSRVQYYRKNDALYKESIQSNPHTVVFWKRDKYQNQQEYRIYLSSSVTNGSDHLSINIGSIYDIAQIFPASDLLDGEIWRQEKISI